MTTKPALQEIFKGLFEWKGKTISRSKNCKNKCIYEIKGFVKGCTKYKNVKYDTIYLKCWKKRVKNGLKLNQPST